MVLKHSPGRLRHAGSQPLAHVLRRNGGAIGLRRLLRLHTGWVSCGYADTKLRLGG